MLMYEVVKVLLYFGQHYVCGAEFSLVNITLALCRCVAGRAEHGFHRSSRSHTASFAARWPAQRRDPLSTNQVHRLLIAKSPPIGRYMVEYSQSFHNLR